MSRYELCLQLTWESDKGRIEMRAKDYVGAELRSEQCLQDSGPGGQILRNVSRIVALEVRL